jgi:hypothetical protein
MKEKETDQYTVESQLIEEEKKRKVKIKIRVETVNKEVLVGYLYLDKATYRRISDFLNDTAVAFLMLTDVKDISKEGEVTYPFIAVNKRHVVMLSET